MNYRAIKLTLTKGLPERWYTIDETGRICSGPFRKRADARGEAGRQTAAPPWDGTSGCNA